MKNKRILSFLFAVLMVVNLFSVNPVNAFAAEMAEETESVIIEDNTETLVSTEQEETEEISEAAAEETTEKEILPESGIKNILRKGWKKR